MAREVPTFDVLELAAKRARFAWCVPVINEGERIRHQLQRMTGGVDCADIVIADGGSTDGSLEPDFLRAMQVRARLTKTGPGRLGAQIRMAFAWCLDQGYDGVVLMDGNDKDEPAELPRFINKLDEGYDFVQGSRFVPGGQAVRTPPSRLWGIRLIHAPVLSLAARHRFTDTTNGFRAYSRRLLEDPRMALFRDQLAGYELHYYLSVRAARLGLRCVEVPVTRSYPASGEVPSKIHGMSGNLKVLRSLAEVCLGHYDP